MMNSSSAGEIVKGVKGSVETCSEVVCDKHVDQTLAPTEVSLKQRVMEWLIKTEEAIGNELNDETEREEGVVALQTLDKMASSSPQEFVMEIKGDSLETCAEEDVYKPVNQAQASTEVNSSLVGIDCKIKTEKGMENSVREDTLREERAGALQVHGKNVSFSAEVIVKKIEIPNWESCDKDSCDASVNQKVQAPTEVSLNQLVSNLLIETEQGIAKEVKGETKQEEGATALETLGVDEGNGDVLLYDPLEADYALDIGLLRENDPAADATGKSLFKEGRAKDVPCKFHNGFSQTCWKGSNCPYSHDLYTGGVFARKHPDFAMAASARREATALTRLPSKPIMGKETQIICRVTHVESPSEFFIEPLNELNCACRKVGEEHQKRKQEEQKEKDPRGNYQLDAYDFGYGCMELPQGIGTEAEQQQSLAPKPLLDLLQNFLHAGLNYRKYQTDRYIPNVELVAVKINTKWMRALVLWAQDGDVTKHGPPRIRVQLLETGEKVCVSVKDVCRLPEKFTTMPAAAFRCCLFGVSPINLTWNKSATRYFKELVENKEVLLIVKQGIPDCLHVNVFEKRPYMVKLVVKTSLNRYTDVAHSLIKNSFGLQWNPYPYRPFAKQQIDPKELDAVYVPVAKPLPDHAIWLENERLGYYGMTKFGFGKPKSNK